MNELVNKSAEMAENDPHGFIITIVSVSVVFAALIILYFAYTLVGKIVNSKVSQQAQNQPTPEEAAAISLALQQHLDDTKHDKESYVITIRRGGKQVVDTPVAPIQQTDAISPTPLAGCSTKPSSKVQNIVAPLPGVIVSIKVNVGDQIRAGQTVAILEAMKMENELQAECDGKVKSINVSNGESVLEGMVIITIG